MTNAMSVLSNGVLELSVAPRGAEMQSLRSAAGDDYLWNGDGAFWTGRAPVLFPIVGRSPGDIVATGSHSAPMGQHGFARRSTFALVEETATSCHHVLTATDDTRAVYPFDFALHVFHRIDGSTVHCDARVENAGDAPMPFGLGFHPAFRWPLPGAGTAPHFVTLAGGGNPNRRALDDGLLDPATIPGPFTHGPSNGPDLEFSFRNLPDFALWKPHGAPFLCIEPWHGTASCVGDGPQIADRPNAITLEPGGTADFGYSVTIGT